MSTRREEPPKSFAQPNNNELVHTYTESELRKVGINLQQIDVDGTIITDRKVPEEIMSRIRAYANYKGITVKFLMSE